MKSVKQDPVRRRLDNVALAFPAATGKADSRVFRIYCRLRETVDGVKLQQALEEAVKLYPIFHSVLRRGNFWYYFESSDSRPVVSEERDVPCSPIYEEDSDQVLYRVTYRDCCIHLEIFHALSDGTGAIEFLSEIVKRYLGLVHGVEGGEAAPVREVQQEDGFFRYYSRDRQEKQKRRSSPAYQIRGARVKQEEMRITECTVSVQQLLEKTRVDGVSITEYMTALLIEAIALSNSWGFPGRRRNGRRRGRKPITIMVPVNLRKFYPSRSMANFFGWMEIEYDFCGGDSFAQVRRHVKKRFAEDLERAQVAARMNRFIRLEKHPIMQIIPLRLKDIGLKIGTSLGGRNVTAVFSNMGVVRLPACYEPYIDQFGAIASTDKLQILACSWGDRFYFSITSKFRSTDIQRNLLMLLNREGIRVTLETAIR